MRHAPSGLLVSMAILVLAGCFGMCGYTPDSAVWREEGLAQWLEGHPVPRATRSTGADGLPFTGEVDGVRPQALRAVTFEQPAGGGATFLSMDQDGMVWTSGQEGGEEGMRRDFQRFAANVSAANATVRHEAEEAFIASAESSSVMESDENGTLHDHASMSYHGAMPGPYRLDALVAELDVTWPDVALDPYREPGTVTAHANGWSFEFVVTHWTIALERGAITVDLLDRVSVSGVFAEDDGDADVARKVRRAFDEAGLPEPHLEGMTHGGSVC